MPRNNGWLAVLAVSVVLSILRNSLAGERYPLNYGNPELQVNRSKSVRVHRDSNRPSLSTQYYPRDHGESSNAAQTSRFPGPDKPNPIIPKVASKQIPRIPKTTRPYSHNEHRRSNDDPSIHPVQIEETRIPDRPPEDHSIERSNSRPTIQSDVQGARRSTGLGKEIPQATRLSSRIRHVAIKDTSAGSNRATHRPDEPATTRGRKTAGSGTIRRGNGFVDLGHPYYGHVGVSSRDEDSQATSTAAGDAAGRGGIAWDVNSPEMERSDTKNGLETVSNIEKRDIGSWWRSGDAGERGQFGEKGYSTMRVNDYVNRAPMVSDKSGLNMDGATGGEELDRHGLMIREGDSRWRYRLVYDLMNGKRRPRRSVGKFREMLGSDSADLNASQFFDGTSASKDRFETEIVRRGYRSPGREGLVYDSASRRSVTVSMAENRDELDGVTPKRRSTIGNDDQGDNGIEYSRTVDRNASGSSFNETRTFDENSVGIIYNVRAENLLERKINNDEKNIGKGLTFNFIEETVVDNLSLHRKYNTSLSDGTGAMLKINSSMLNNSYGLTGSQTDLGSIDQIKIGDSLNNKEIVRSELYGNKTEMEPNSLHFEGPSNLISLDASEVTVDNRNLRKPTRDQEWQANQSSKRYSRLKINIPTTNNGSQNWNTNETSFNKVTNDPKFPSNISCDDNNSQLKSNSSVSIAEPSYTGSDINKTFANINKMSISLNTTELVSSDPNKNAPQSQTSVLISTNATNTDILRVKNDSINVKNQVDDSTNNTKTMSAETNKNDSKIRAGLPILSNESVTKIFHLAKHLPEEIESENSRSRIDGVQGRANRDPQDDRPVLCNVTKGEENVLANSPRGSIAVPRNSTYPSHDMNTLAERSFSSESKDLAQYDERNADDPFRNSPTANQGRIAETAKIITNPRRPLMNKDDPSESKHLFPASEQSRESRNISSSKAAKKGRKIDDGINQWIGSKNSKVDNYEAGLDGSPIVRKDENADDLRSRVSLSENGADEIKANEPAVRFSVKNARDQAVRANSSDNGTANEVNPGQENKESSDDPADRPSEDSTPSKVVAGPDGRSPKGRTSRSSSKARMTTSSLIQGRNMKIESLLADKTSTSMWRKGDIPSNGNLSTKNDSTSPGVDKDTLGVLGKSPLNPRDRSTVSTMANGTARILEELLSNENLTGGSLESVTSINDDEYQSFVFDASFVATSLEPNDEEFRGTIMDSADSHGTDNSTHELEPLDQWPVKHSAVVEGDLVLGGLMMVHEREDTITCGPVMPQGGVQALEAMLYTLDMLNEREIVPGVKIGAHILDDCDKDTYGLEMAVDFIKGSISNIDGAEYHCNKTAVRKVISGVVGAASSVTSIQVANLLRLFRIPQVSFFSTSPELSNKQRFEYFTRTIPSDHYQVKAMVDIVLTMGWSYVSIIYEESNYGIKAFEELEELLGKYDICIAIKEKLVKDSGVAEETAYDNIVLKLLTKPRARGCIIFGSDQEVAGVMRAVRRCNATGAFSWIGSDGWSARGLVSNGNEPEVEGTLSVQPQANPVKGFEEYFLNLTVENNRRNPWFVEFWEDHFQCRYPNASRTPYNQKYTKPCTTKERLTKQATAFEDQLQFVSDAVMAFAYAFRDMHRDLCHGKPGLCDAMKPTKGTELLKYLRKVDFEGLSGDKFKFDKNGDGPARYNIIHFKQVEPGKYKWIRVGKYLEGELRLNMSEIQFKLGHPQSPESVCSLPCEVGQAKKYVEGERCCWHCFNCTQYQIRHPIDETQCIPCRQGTVPDETHSTCRDIPEEFLRPESGWAIGAMSFSATGILITFFVCGVFLKHNDTPVVRASGRELSYVLLSGILLCYLVTFALVLRPTDIVCGIQRFTAGFCFTVVYAALLTKTNRISRIFNASKHSAKRPSFISPRSQLIICSGLVFVQILINGVWMIIDPARAMHHYPTREDNLLVCNSYVDASYMIVFAYPIMLIVVCTVYAVLTRKIPEAFNESKHIGFTMYTTCVIWLAFVPLYFGTGSNVALRITSMSVTISLSASVTIACLFSPKLYIILIRPERNVRQSMMPARYGTTKSSAVTATNASSMIAPVTLTAATCDQNKAVKRHIITTIDCSTQSEYYELEVKDQKNGKPPPTVVSRSTQTSNNNEKESNAVATSIESKDSTTTTKQLNNNARIGNGPVNQSDVPL